MGLIKTIIGYGADTGIHESGLRSYMGQSFTYPKYDYNPAVTSCADYEQWMHNQFQEKPKKGGPMKNLYNVIAVSRDEVIITDAKVVAEDENEAAILAEVGTAMKKFRVKAGDVTVICHNLGEVRVRPDIQRVQIIPDEAPPTAEGE